MFVPIHVLMSCVVHLSLQKKSLSVKEFMSEKMRLDWKLSVNLSAELT